MTAKVLVTSALPYANGPIHFGHIVGAYLPADIYVRARRMMGDEVLYVCGTDEHGVTIVQNAERAGLPCQEFVDRWHAAIAATFSAFDIRFDIFSGTSAGKNRFHAPIAQEFFRRLHANGHVSDRLVRQLYCAGCGRFLADRYVEGTCPRCGHPRARGDECGACGHWIDPLELGNPRCKQCGAAPEARETRHWFLDLPRLRAERIEEWFRAKEADWKPNVKAFVENMLADLKDRPITRDLGWGVPVPLPGTEGKVLYVWFDAPIGYVSATMQLFADKGEPDGWRKWWQDPSVELIHFIGKDNIPFHMVVFPAMLHGVGDGYILPANVPANEFYNLEGGKFSTSEGWFIPLDTFASDYAIDAARYALIVGAPETRDTEFTWKGFQSRVNDELADTLGNLAARVLRFVERYRGGVVPGRADEPSAAEQGLLALRGTKTEEFTQAILGFQFRKAASALMDLAREGNRVFDAGQPWRTRREAPDRCSTTLWAGAETLRSLALLAAPIMPRAAQRLWEMLGLPGSVADRRLSEAGATVFPGAGGGVLPDNLFEKIPDERIATEEAALRERKARAAGVAPFLAPIDPEEFAKLDLRVGVVRQARPHPKADKLLVLTVDLGGESRTVVAGIAGHYAPESLAGRAVVVAANLPPRKLRGIESQGMVLAATGPDGAVHLLGVDQGASPGQKIS